MTPAILLWKGFNIGNGTSKPERAHEPGEEVHYNLIMIEYVVCILKRSWIGTIHCQSIQTVVVAFLDD